MSQSVRIDFVSDVSCPWCAIGFTALSQAIARVAPEINVELHCQPFELNPAMAPEGQDIVSYMTEKTGASLEQQIEMREAVRQRGAAVGFEFDMARRGRIYNTFDAHCLLRWAADLGRQQALQQALFEAYFTQGEDPSSRTLLVRLAGQVGLDTAEAARVLETGEFAEEVRATEQFFQRAGIRSVPSVVINQRHLIAGGQPVEVFERALREIAGGADKS